MNTPLGIQETLRSRGNIHGDFAKGSKVMQDLKSTAHCAPNWNLLSPSQKESIEMILHKVGRVLCGDPNHVDHWHDIAGYATLVENILTTGESHPASLPPLSPSMKSFGPRIFNPVLPDLPAIGPFEGNKIYPPLNSANSPFKT